MIHIATLFLWFLMYSFLGWLYESTLCSITGKKLVNRGFLYGPICPVYGCGAMIVILTLQNLDGGKSIIPLFLSSLVLTSVLEYFTSWAMEKLFHARWWDYSDRKFNLNGRVCLLGALVFATLSVLLLKVIHPFLSAKIASLPTFWLLFISSVCFLLFISDTALNVYGTLKLNHKLEELQVVIEQEVEKSRQRLSELKENLSERKEQFQEKADELRESIQQKYSQIRETDLDSTRILEQLSRFRFSERRILRAFPNMTSTRNKEALEQLRLRLKNYKKKK